MDKTRNYLFVIGLSIIMLSCSTQAAEKSSQAPSSTTKLPVDVKVVSYQIQRQEESVAGSILAHREVDITSEIARKVSSIHFSDGSNVVKGQLLYKLEDGDIRARIRQTEAELALAALTEKRLAQLLKNESVRQEEYDVAKTQLNALQATKELLEVELAKTSIVAPFSGAIGISRIQTGSFVAPGSTLVSIREQDAVKVEFTVSEKYLETLKKSKKIYFSAAGNGDKLVATISAIESAVDEQSRTITVHATALNSSGKLKPGMSARVFFSTVAEDSKVLMLPTEALIPGANGYNVFVIKNGAAKMTPVTVGNRNESDAFITAGVNDGDTVMVSNILRTSEGTPVQIVSAK